MTERLTLSVRETAEELGLSERTVYELVKRPDFPAVRIGNRIRVSREGLLVWLKAIERGEITV